MCVRTCINRHLFITAHGRLQVKLTTKQNIFSKHKKQHLQTRLMCSTGTPVQQEFNSSVKVCTTTLSVSHPLCDSWQHLRVLEDEIRRTRVPVQSVYNSHPAICTHKLLHDHIKTVKMARWSSLKCALLLVCWHDDPWPTHAFALRPISGSLFMPPA